MRTLTEKVDRSLKQVTFRPAQPDSAVPALPHSQHAVLQMQRTIGNQAVGRLLKARQAVAAPAVQRAPWGICPPGKTLSANNPFRYGAAELGMVAYYKAVRGGNCVATNVDKFEEMSCKGQSGKMLQKFKKHFRSGKQPRKFRSVKPTGGVTAPEKVKPVSGAIGPEEEEEGVLEALKGGEFALEEVFLLLRPDIIDFTRREIYDVTTANLASAKVNKVSGYIKLAQFITGRAWTAGSTLKPPGIFRLHYRFMPGELICYGPTDLGKNPGVLAYSVIEDDKTKKKSEKEKEEKQKKEEKETGPGGKAGNYSFGIGILSTGGGSGNAGIGVSIMSHGQTYGTVSGGVVYNSHGKAVGALGVGAASSSSSVGVGIAAAVVSKESTSVGAGVAGAGKSEGSMSSAAGVAGAGSSKGDVTAAAGTAGAGKSEGNVAAVAGQAGKADVQGTIGAQAGKGSTQGQGGPSSQAGLAGAKSGGVGARTGGAGQSKYGLVIPGQSAAAVDKAVEQAGQIDALLQKARPAQRALLAYLAQKEADRRYVVPAVEWARMILAATDKIGDDDLAYLITLEWNPAHVTAEELRAHIQKALQSKKAGAAPGLPLEAQAVTPVKPEKAPAVPKVPASTAGTGEGKSKAPAESQQDRVARLAKRAGVYKEWSMFKLGRIHWAKPPVKKGSGQLYLKFPDSQSGAELHATADIAGTVKREGKDRVLIVQSSSELVTADGQVISSSALIGQRLHFEQE